MKASKPVLFSVGGGAIILIVLVLLSQTGYFSTAEDKTNEFHSREGFTVEYPNAWVVDDSRKDAPADFIREPSGRAFVAMQTGQDERLKNPALRDEALKEAQAAFEKYKRYRVDIFEWKPRDAKLDGDSYMAAGSYGERNEEWRFREIAVFNPSGRIFLLRGNVRKDYAKTFGPIVDKILFSFRPTIITSESARLNVESLPEVREYEKMLAKAGKEATIEVEDRDGEWSVHVFEVVEEEGGSSHTATFGWYRVDKKTGSAEKEN